MGYVVALAGTLLGSVLFMLGFYADDISLTSYSVTIVVSLCVSYISYLLYYNDFSLNNLIQIRLTDQA